MEKEQPESMLAFHRSHLQSTGARLGRLLRRDRKPIDTPHYVATTSRGAVPHLAPDLLQQHSSISSVYLALEDFIEKKLANAPMLQTPTEPGQSPLRTYIAAHDDLLTILAPRRIPPLACRMHNTNSAISISTSVGFSQLAAADYHTAAQSLAPDILVAMADVAPEPASLKRIGKSADRTHAWWQEAVEQWSSSRNTRTAVFAALPPVDNVQQHLYLQDLAVEDRDVLGGLALYTASAVVDLPEPLAGLPRLCLTNPDSPHALLDAIDVGADLLTVPFATTCSEHGIALSFDFPGPVSAIDSPPLPLAFDLWAPEHQTSLRPLTPACPCFACSRHHRAYIHHLLQVKEMLAWTLLQLHNYAVLDRVFAAVRASIQRGTWESDVAKFRRGYVRELPARTGKGPRIRGYQAKSVGGEEGKRNEKVWGRFSDQGNGGEEVGTVESTVNTGDLPS